VVNRPLLSMLAVSLETLTDLALSAGIRDLPAEQSPSPCQCITDVFMPKPEHILSTILQTGTVPRPAPTEV
jgi:hypothetical protein